MSLRLAGTLISGAMLGKLLGFLREIEMARLIGASFVADSFRGAMTAVLLPVAPIQNDSVISILIPLHREWQAQGDAPQRTGALTLLVAGLGVVMGCAVFLLAAPWIGVLVGQFDAQAQALTIRFVQIMALALPASVLTGVLGSIEMATGRSSIAAMRASVQNLGLMAGIAVMAWIGQPLAIAWGFVLAFNLVAAFALATLWRARALTLRGVQAGMLGAVGLVFWGRFRTVLGIPVAEQGNILLERMLASGVAIGAVASLDYARTLTETTFYLVSQPIGYVVLTRAAGRLQDTPGEVRMISARLLALGLPLSVFTVLFAPDIVTVVFARGAFDAYAVALTAGAMRGIAAGLWAAMLGWVLIRMLNVSGRNGMAAAIVIAAFGVNALWNVFAVPRLGTLGLGLGEALRSLVLLGGTAAALGCVKAVLLSTGRAGIVTLPLALVGVLIQSWTDASLLRLMLAAAVFGVVTTTWLARLLPDQRRWVAAALRRPLRLAPRG